MKYVIGHLAGLIHGMAVVISYMFNKAIGKPNGWDVLMGLGICGIIAILIMAIIVCVNDED